jgi:hypothetical protein
MTGLATIVASRPVTLRRWFVTARGQLERIPMSLILLGMRIAVASVFLKSGLLKINCRGTNI